MRIGIINGPNLNEIGLREPEIYGHQTFEDAMNLWKASFPKVHLSLFQSNHEGALIDHIQEAKHKCVAFVINAAAYTHTSVAIADALRSCSIPIIEVHLSNIFAREPYRHHSFISPIAEACIVGMGMKGYEMAIRYLLDRS